MLKSILLAGSMSAFIATGAFAQSVDQPVADAQVTAAAAPATATDPTDTGDIVVTANRTSSLLSKTPIAMTAVTGSDLAQAGITDPTQLDEAVPNISFVRTNGNGVQVTIRGVTSSDGSEKGDPSAAVMLNGIYLARPQAQDVAFFDIDRIEVLRGPQGTLYGRNSTAGVVNIISARPKMQFGASVDGSYASFNSINATATLNVPVSDTFALRAAANLDRRDNYVIDGNRGDGVTLNPFRDNQSFRLSALYEPSKDFSILLVGDYSRIKGTTDVSVAPSNFYTNIVTGPRATFERPTFVSRSARDYRRFPNPLAQQSSRDNDEKGVMGELNYNFGLATFTYLGGYRETGRDERANYALGAVSADIRAHYWQTSHEARLAFGQGGPLQVQVGGYYFKEKSGIELFFNNLTGANTRFGFPQDPTISENKSAFGQATWEVIPNLRFTGGVRYSHDLKSRVGQTVLDRYTSVVDSNNIGTLIDRTVLQNNNARRTFSQVTWRGGVDYDSPLGLIFASVSTGYKAGGFNDGCEQGTAPGCNQPAAALYYDPETLTSYEAGFKFRFAPALRLNGTAFHYDFSNLQLSQFSTICGGPCQVTTNAAAAKVDGVEMEAQIQPVKPFTIRLAFNYLDARYDRFVPRPGVDLSGFPLARSPKVTWSAGGNYSIPVGDGRIEAAAGLRFSSSYELTDLENFAYFQQPAFTKTDLSLTYTAPGDRFYVAGFVENLENNIVVTNVTTGGFGAAIFADPRRFGMRGGIKF